MCQQSEGWNKVSSRCRGQPRTSEIEEENVRPNLRSPEAGDGGDEADDNVGGTTVRVRG